MSADQAKPSKPSKPAKGAPPPAKKGGKEAAKGAPPPAKKGGKETAKGPASLAGNRPPLPAGYVPQLKQHYQQHVVAALRRRFNYSNPMEVPRLEKIVVNMGVGRDAVGNPRVIDAVLRELAIVTGQRPAVAKARNSISNFKLRAGMPIGVYVTLRRNQMWEFLERLISIAAPRIRDFRGFPDKGFDGRGNYTMGIKEHIVFPEIDLDAIEKIRGMDVTFVTTARTDVEAFELLKEVGLPMRKREAARAVAGG